MKVFKYAALSVIMLVTVIVVLAVDLADNRPKWAKESYEID